MYTPIVNNSKHYGNNRWFTFSPKLQRAVRLYSDLEYDNWVLVETNPLVFSFCEQPLRIRTGINGQLIESIPDMWIKWRNGQESFVEVKYSHQLEPEHPKADARSILQIQCQRQWCQEAGYNHKVYTEKEIRQNLIYLSNMKRLLPYLLRHLNSVETDNYILLRHIQHEPTRLSQLFSKISLPQVRIVEALTRLFLEGLIKANFGEQPIGDKTEVWLNAD